MSDYQFHGWVELWASNEEEDDDELLAKKLENLKREVARIDWASGKAEVLTLNGIDVLTMHCAPNRRRDEAEEMQGLIDLVIQDFKSAFGLVYEHDANTEVEHGVGVFSVKVIRNGTCEVRLDPFLSPRIPVVEEAYSPDSVGRIGNEC